MVLYTWCFVAVLFVFISLGDCSNIAECLTRECLGGNNDIFTPCRFKSGPLPGTLPSICPDITRLILVAPADGVGVTGTLPKEWGNFTKLTGLFADDNDISGTLPPQWAGLSSLETLKLARNKLTGSLPEQWNQLPNLQFLSLEENTITGTLHSSWANITSLTTLFLFDNDISGVLPPSWQSLDMQSLGVSDNRLSGTLPPAYSNWTNLGNLFLNGNDLSGTLPKQYGSLFTGGSPLLDLSNNNFIGSLPAEWSGMTSLFEMILSNNLLTGTIPYQWDAFVPDITVNLVNNRLTGKLTQNWTVFGNLFLAGNDFDRDCDCDTIALYQSMTDIINDISDMEPCASANEFSGISPLVLEPNPQAPCFHASFTGEEINSRNFTVHWEDSNDLVSDQFSSELPNSTAVWGTDDCGMIVDIAFDLLQSYDFEAGGFEVILHELDSDVTSRRCFFEQELAGLSPEHFKITFSEAVLPNTVYEVSVRPFNFTFSKEVNVTTLSLSYIYGPRSRTITILTDDDIPETLPTSLSVEAARSNEITFTWKPPEGPGTNGAILGYEMVCLDEEENEFSTFSNVSVVTVRSLRPTSEYRCKVRGRTSVGYSVNFTDPISVVTCAQNTNRLKGSTECIADIGFFLNADGEAENCQNAIGEVILEADACSAEGVTVQDINLQPGFWRANVYDFTEILPCPRLLFCEKTRPENTTTAELQSVQCSENHRGTYCYSCDEGFALSLLDGCRECDDATVEKHQGNFTFLVCTILLVILLSLVYVFVQAKRSSEGSKKESCCADRTRTFQSANINVKFRILESFLQVLFAFRVMLFVDAPSTLFSDIINALSNLDLALLAYSLEIECAVTMNHYTSLLLYSIPSLLLLGLLFVLYRISTRYYTSKAFLKEIQQESFSLFFIVSFLIYPGASRIIVSTFVCESFDTVANETDIVYREALRSDYRISCEAGGERIFWLFLAGILVVLFPIGIIAVYSYFLHRYNNSEDKQKERYTQLVKDLIYPYRPNRFWFEAYDLLRKLAQTSGVALCLGFGTKNATAIALNMSIFFFLLLAYLNPYKSRFDFYYALSTMLVIILCAQLDTWFDSLDCNEACKASKTADAFLLMVFGAIAVGLIFAILQKRDESKKKKLGLGDGDKILTVSGNNTQDEDLDELRSQLQRLTDEIEGANRKKERNLEVIDRNEQDINDLQDQLQKLSQTNI